MKLPDCHEVCRDCKDGKHIFHVLNELADIWAEIIDVDIDGMMHKKIRINGYAEDELWLEDLFKCVGLALSHLECQHCHTRSLNPKTNSCYKCNRISY